VVIRRILEWVLVRLLMVPLLLVYVVWVPWRAYDPRRPS
jgi:hypothetical protein